MTTSTSLLGSFTCRKFTTWDRWLYFPSEGRRAEDFFARKIRWLRLGLKPRTRVPNASTLTSRPPNPLFCVTVLRFRHLGRDFLKPDDFEDMSVSKILHFARSAGPLKEWAIRAAQKIDLGRSAWVNSACLSVFCSLLRHDFGKYVLFFSITLLLLLLLLLEVLQLQGSFGLLNEFFPFGPVSDAVPPVCYFHICYVTFYIIFPPIFRSS